MRGFGSGNNFKSYYWKLNAGVLAVFKVTLMVVGWIALIFPLPPSPL